MLPEDIQRLREQNTTKSHAPIAKTIHDTINQIKHELTLISNHTSTELYDVTPLSVSYLEDTLRLLKGVHEKLKYQR